LELETTNIRVLDPTTHPCPSHVCLPPCATPPPHFPFAAHPLPPLPPATPPPSITPAASCHLFHHHHSSPEHHRSPIKLPHQLPQFTSQAKHTPDKNLLCQITSNSIFHSLAPKITMLGDSWIEDYCTWFIVLVSSSV
jgi:hypothetical protein